MEKAIKHLGDRIKAFFKSKEIEDKKALDSVNSNLQDIENVVQKAVEAISEKNDEAIIGAIETLRESLEEKNLEVNVEAPKIEIPEPKIIHDQKEIKDSILKLAQIIAKQDNGVRILNQTPSEAVPVVLTDKERKKFTEIGNQILNIANASQKPVYQDANFDSFGRLRISNPETLFDSKQIHDDQTLFWDDAELSGGGTTSTYNTNKASTSIAVAENTAGVRARQTFMRFNYQPGKSQLIFLTGTFGARSTGVTKRFGAFDSKNGFFLEQDEDGVYFVKRTYISGAAVDTRIAQANWNFDKFDGQGTSRCLLDDTKSQIVVIDYEWLGIGTVRIGFVVDGEIRYAHYFQHANRETGVYTSTPNHPLRYEIEASGTNDAASLEHICSSVMSEGGTQEIGPIFGVDMGTTQITGTTAGVTYALIGLRLKSAYIGEIVKLLNLSTLITANSNYRWSLHYNPTVAGTFTYGSVDDESGVEAAIGTVTNIITDEGILIDSGYASSSLRAIGEELQNGVRLGQDLSGALTTIVLGMTPFNNNSGLIGSIAFREIA
jgi:hypothetical protein